MQTGLALFEQDSRMVLVYAVSDEKLRFPILGQCGPVGVAVQEHRFEPAVVTRDGAVPRKEIRPGKAVTAGRDVGAFNTDDVAKDDIGSGSIDVGHVPPQSQTSVTERIRDIEVQSQAFVVIQIGRVDDTEIYRIPPPVMH